MALAVPLSRFTPRVGGGSAFFVRRHYAMRAFAYYSLALVSALAVFTGCASAHHSSQSVPIVSRPPNLDLFFLDVYDAPSLPVSQIPPADARLSQAQAIGIAKRTAKLRRFDLTEYNAPDAYYDVKYGWRKRYATWCVGFESKVWFPGSCRLIVFVDDQTSGARLIAGD